MNKLVKSLLNSKERGKDSTNKNHIDRLRICELIKVPSPSLVLPQQINQVQLAKLQYLYFIMLQELSQLRLDSFKFLSKLQNLIVLASKYSHQVLHFNHQFKVKVKIRSFN